MNKWQCPVHNGTLSHKSDLRISTAGKNIRIIRIEHLKTKKNGNFFHIIDQRKVARLPNCN